MTSGIPIPTDAPAIALPGDDDQLRRNGLPSYAKPGPYTTKLSPQDEQQFHAWVQQNNIPWRDTPNNDYDMRGFWKAQQGGDPNARRATNLHFPDTWKTPYHESFSNESMYATPDAPHWNEDSLETTVPNAPAISLPNQSIPSLTSGAAIRPSATSMNGRGIPVTPQTGGKAIPLNRATGQPEELNNEGKPIAPGVAGLWAKSENIHNPFLRGLAKIGSVAARAIDVAGSVAAPGIAAQIPGSTLNQKIGENRAEKQQTADTENTERQAVTAHTQAETAAEPTEVAYKQAQTAKTNKEAELAGEPKPKEESWDVVPGFQGPNGEPILVEKNSGQQKLATAIPGVKPKATKETQITQAEQLKQDIADAYEKGDQVTVKQKQNELKAIDPEGAQRIAIQLGNQDDKRANEVEKKNKPFQDVLDQISEGRQFAQTPSPTNDFGLLMAFVGVTKPESVGKIRFNQQELRTVVGTRSTLGDVQALEQKLANGEMLTPKQRQDMLDTMAIVEQHAQRRLGGGTEAVTSEPARPANVPAGYVFKENGPKGRGWYKP